MNCDWHYKGSCMHACFCFVCLVGLDQKNALWAWMMQNNSQAVSSCKKMQAGPFLSESLWSEKKNTSSNCWKIFLLEGNERFFFLLWLHKWIDFPHYFRKKLSFSFICVTVNVKISQLLLKQWCFPTFTSLWMTPKSCKNPVEKQNEKNQNEQNNTNNQF